MSSHLPRRETAQRIVRVTENCSGADILSKAEYLKETLAENSTTDLPWTRVLNADQLLFTKVLCDVIIPSDELGPSASSVYCHEFIDEWLSAPNEFQEKEIERFQKNFGSIDKISQKTYGKNFVCLDYKEQQKVLQQIVDERQSEYRSTYKFLVYFRKLVAIAYYTTPIGWNAIGYVDSDVAPSMLKGPPQEVLKELGL